MSVGGRLIEIAPYGADLVRLWVVDADGMETCVLARPEDHMPSLGDELWCQSLKIVFDGDRRSLIKVGHSFPAPTSEP